MPSRDSTIPLANAPRSVAVFGGGGFLGRHVVRLAAASGLNAISLSRRNGCDLADSSVVEERLRDLRPAAIINCAAHVGSVHYAMRNSADMMHDNVQIIMNLYRAVQRVCPTAKIIHPISNCSYPGEAVVQRESEWFDGPVHPSVRAFGSPRRLIYEMADCYRRQHGIRSINWLIPNAYGPGDRTDPDRVHALNGIIIRLIQAQRAESESFEIWGTGKPIREWGYIEDVARILVQSVDLDEQLYPVNLAQNRGYSILEISEIAARLLDYRVRLTFNTQFPDGTMSKVLDDQEFRARYRDFRFTPLEEGIRRTIDYYRAELPVELLAEKDGV